MMGFSGKLFLLPESMAICRMPKDTPLPPWALTSSFFSVTRTAEELSVVCPQINVPEGIKRDEGWWGLNPKQIQIFKIQSSNLSSAFGRFKLSSFEIVSNFGFRASDLES